MRTGCRTATFSGVTAYNGRGFALGDQSRAIAGTLMYVGRGHWPESQVAAIVDWEMTTVGDPLLDLAWCLLGYDGELPRTDGFYLDLLDDPRLGR